MARTAKKQKELTPEEKLAQALVPVEDQPYPVPEKWAWVYGKYLFKSMETKKPSGEWFIYVDIESIDNQHQTIKTPKKIETQKAPSRASRALHSGDTVFSMVRPYLKNIAYIDESLSSAIASTGFYICSPTPFLNSKYNYYLMTSSYVVDGLNAFMKGDNSPSIRQADIEHFPFPIPPLAEQQRIVDRIESLFSKLDEAKEKAQSVIDSYEDRKSAILHQAFSGELTKEWRKQHNVLFSQWENVKLKDCGDWMGGGTPSMSHPEYWENGDILWVTSKDMKADVIDDTLLYVNEKGINNSSANYNEKPSVLFVMRSGILRRTLPIAYIKKPFTVNQDLRAVSPSKIDTKYLFWACKSLEKKMLKTCMKSGTTVESINANALMDFEIPVAPQEEQGVIVEAINELLQKESASKLVAQETVRHVEQMKKAITMKAFRGELETNNPTDEEAEDLLKKIM